MRKINFHYLCRYGKQIINIMENLFDVILNSLESQSKGREHFTVCLTLEAETLNIPFDIYLRIFLSHRVVNIHLFSEPCTHTNLKLGIEQCTSRKMLKIKKDGQNWSNKALGTDDSLVSQDGSGQTRSSVRFVASKSA